MTNRKGYDNQPAFTADGKGFYFVSINKDTTQSDIYKCDLTLRTVTRITHTATSEYSPMLTPDGEGLSVVRVDPDSGQRFYILPLIAPKVANHVENSDSIGYYTWTSDSTIAMFVLDGPKHTLQSLNIRTGERRMLANSVGRCLKTDSGKRHLYYSDKSDSTRTTIRIIDLTSFKDKSITDCLAGSEDFEVLPDGSMLMGASNKLYQYSDSRSEWIEVADFSGSMQGFYRIVMDPSGKLLALVAYNGTKP
jgi:tricorn protease-like protein